MATTVDPMTLRIIAEKTGLSGDTLTLFMDYLLESLKLCDFPDDPHNNSDFKQIWDGPYGITFGIDSAKVGEAITALDGDQLRGVTSVAKEFATERNYQIKRSEEQQKLEYQRRLAYQQQVEQQRLEQQLQRTQEQEAQQKHAGPTEVELVQNWREGAKRLGALDVKWDGREETWPAYAEEVLHKAQELRLVIQGLENEQKARLSYFGSHQLLAHPTNPEPPSAKGISPDQIPIDEEAVNAKTRELLGDLDWLQDVRSVTELLAHDEVFGLGDLAEDLKKLNLYFKSKVE